MPLSVRDVLLMKKLEIEETQTTKYSTFKTDIIKVGLVFRFPTFLLKKVFWQIDGRVLATVIQLSDPRSYGT